MTDEALRSDLVIVGAGMAGLSAAATAVSLGLRVTVVEKADHPGGAALVSGGILWLPADYEVYTERDSLGDARIIERTMSGIDEAVEWLRELGIAVSEPFRIDHATRFPAVARKIDPREYVTTCVQFIERNGGQVLTGTEASRLLTAGNTVTGVEASRNGSTLAAHAPWTVLATGGFHDNPELRAEILGEGARDIVVRAPSGSDGAGLELARSVGARAITTTRMFYGNLLPAEMPRAFQMSDFARLSQYQSCQSILLDRTGARIGDESASYYNNGVLVSQAEGARALMVGDQRARERGMKDYENNVDRVAEAANDGARAVWADTPEDLARKVSAWGYTGVEKAIADFNDLVTERRAPTATDPSRIYNSLPIVDPPYFAVEVQAGITFPFGGLQTDVDGRVLDESGIAIRGLLAAGVDVHVFHDLYGGALAMSLVGGRHIAKYVASVGAVAQA